MFLDRDGVLNELVWREKLGYPAAPLSLAHFRPFPGIGAAAARLRQAGYLLVVVTNQPGVAKGDFGLDGVFEIHAELDRLMGADGGRPDAFYVCPHSPVLAGTSVPILSYECACRKPLPGMLLQAAGDLDIELTASFMVGDNETDVEAGLAAGCRTVLIAPGPVEGTRAHAVRPTLPAAVEWILRE